MKTLPQTFLLQMKKLLKNEYEDFLDSYEKESAYGLRINPLKTDISRILSSENPFPFTLTPVPWASEGFFSIRDEKPGMHPLHEAGAYYIQEPSAMVAAELLDINPGDYVCDLCAAPGGKTTQLAGKLMGNGLIVSNEIINSRAKILAQNVERLGISNCLVTNEEPSSFMSKFISFFDKIIIDAPCSGEGMFRKDENAISEWSFENVLMCAKRQAYILDTASKMLKPGGSMVYSTCTFSYEENEAVVSEFLNAHPDFELIDWKQSSLGQKIIENDFPDNIICDSLDIVGTSNKAIRMWPHKINGEGHFAALLCRCNVIPEVLLSENEFNEKVPHKDKKKKKKDGQNSKSHDLLLKDAISYMNDFYVHYMVQSDDLYSKILNKDSKYVLFGEELYILPYGIDSIDGLRIVRAGLHLGSLKKNRFEPAYALAKAITAKNALYVHNCTLDEARLYHKGLTLNCDTQLSGWCLVCYNGYSLGWGKAASGIIKNHYPKGLRR